MKDKKQEARVTGSRLGRKYGVSIHIGVDDNKGYFCNISSSAYEENPSRLEKEVADYSAKKRGLYFYPVDMSYPGDEPYSRKMWLWGKYGEFKTLDGIEDFVKNFADCDLERVEELYKETLGQVTKKLREKEEKAGRKPPPKSRIEILLGE